MDWISMYGGHLIPLPWASIARWKSYLFLQRISKSWKVDGQQGLKQKETLQWRHNEPGGVSNHQPHDCLLNRLFRRKSKKTSKLRVTGLSVGNSPVTGEFPAQMASNAENVSIWWRHHERRDLYNVLGCAHCLPCHHTAAQPPSKHSWQWYS